jgi:hypothetical protein
VLVDVEAVDVVDDEESELPLALMPPGGGGGGGPIVPCVPSVPSVLDKAEANSDSLTEPLLSVSMAEKSSDRASDSDVLEVDDVELLEALDVLDVLLVVLEEESVEIPSALEISDIAVSSSV